MPEPTPLKVKLEGRDRFDYWWPVAVRIGGAVIAAYEIVISPPPNGTSLTFAGGLILSPLIVEAQRKRNANRDEDE